MVPETRCRRCAGRFPSSAVAPAPPPRTLRARRPAFAAVTAAGAGGARAYSVSPATGRPTVVRLDGESATGPLHADEVRVESDPVAALLLGTGTGLRPARPGLYRRPHGGLSGPADPGTAAAAALGPGCPAVALVHCYRACEIPAEPAETASPSPGRQIPATITSMPPDGREPSDPDGAVPRRDESALAMYLRWFQPHEGRQVRLTELPGLLGPTAEEFLDFAAGLPSAQVRDLFSRARIATPPFAARRPAADPAPPAFLSWEDFLTRTKAAEVMAWCRAKAKKANGSRLISGKPAVRVTAEDVWGVMAAARGCCAYCGSLAVQKRPSAQGGQPLPWEEVGRRIGSLGHIVPRFDGGTNTPDNLCWSCLWCNTYPGEGRPGATDHGGLQPDGDLCGIPGCGVVRPKDANLPLQPDHCPQHGSALGELCATCLGVIGMVRSEHCLDTRTSLREGYRQHHNKCPGCEPLTALPSLEEVHHCRKVVATPPGEKGFHARLAALWEGWPGNFTDQRWVEDTRNAAKAAGLAVDDYVFLIAQVPHRCGQCEPDAARVPESITRITDELARLRRIHGSLYRITFDPLSVRSWRAKAIGTRRIPLDADSPGGLRLSIGHDKRAAARRASARTS